MLDNHTRDAILAVARAADFEAYIADGGSTIIVDICVIGLRIKLCTVYGAEMFGGREWVNTIKVADGFGGSILEARRLAAALPVAIVIAAILERTDR